jgi:hypothetical protein
MYTTGRQTGAFASQKQASPVSQANDIYRDWTNRNWTAMMSKLDQDSKMALQTANGIALFREELNHLNVNLKKSGFNWYVIDVCHDQNGFPGIITTKMVSTCSGSHSPIFAITSWANGFVGMVKDGRQFASLIRRRVDAEPA